MSSNVNKISPCEKHMPAVHKGQKTPSFQIYTKDQEANGLKLNSNLVN